MKHYGILLSVIFILLFSKLNAQPGCPAVNAGNSITLGCTQSCTTLNATAFSAATTTAYTVGQIPYSPPFSFNTGTSILVAVDDTWGNVINLPFNFCFFGNTYNQIVVGSNGVLSFNTANSGNFNTWTIGGPVPANTPADLTNSIMGPWQDIDPTNMGDIRYQISGTYPCRSFEVSWYQVPYFGDPNSVTTGDCPSPLFATQQIVLYETTNAIEVYIQNKEACTGWNSGLAVEGIVDATGTVAYTVPGRNATVWTAQNDAWRFTPAGAPNYVIRWFDGLTQIGTGNSVQVCPTSTKTYTAQATYTNCDATTTVVTDNVTVTRASVTSQIDSFRNPLCFGGSTGAVYASFNSFGSAVLSYGWTPGGANQTSLTNIPAGTYIFSVTTTDNCTSSDTVTLVNPPALSVNVTTTSAGCGLSNGSATANVTSGNGPFTYVWSNQRTIQTITNIAPGTYTVTVTGAGGCTATASGFVQGTGGLSLSTSSVATSCGGLNGSVTVNVTSGPGVYTYLWSTQDVTQTVTNLGSGTYSVTVSGGNCSASATVSVAPSSALTISASSAATTCGNNNGTASVSVLTGDGPFVYLWNTQATAQSISSLSAGIYSVTVTGLGGCSATSSTSVAPSSSLILNATATNADCGLNTGSASVNVISGTGPFTYLWSNQGNTASITNIGTGNYSVTVTGASNCSASTSVQVTVIDLSPPNAVCQDITISLSGNTASITANDIDGGSTDNCGIVSRDATPTTFDCLNLGGNRVTLTVADGGGNTSNCVATVTVNDTTPPAAICQNITVPLAGNAATITATDVDNNSTDNCAIVTRNVTPNTFSCANLGSNTVTFTAADASGNAGSCTATVTVADVTPPVANCRDITVSVNGGGTASIIPTSVDNGSTDNCAIVSRVVSPNVFSCSMLGQNAVTLTVTDASGNNNNCNATVTVRDNIAPSAVCQSITVALSGNSATVSASAIDNGSADNCAIVSRTLTPNTFNCSNLGANQVSLTVADASGNSSSCLATVTIQDSVPPTALCQNITVALNGNTATVSPTDIDNNSTDNCAIVSRTLLPNTFDCGNIGANAVTLTVADASGNSSNCGATVNVIDNTPPSAQCKDITVPLSGNSASITPADVDNNSSDNCAIVSRVVIPNTFNCSNVGVNPVTMTVTDASANAANCNANVTIQDITPPVALCHNLTVALLGNSVSITPGDIDNGSTDNCAIVSRVVNPDVFDCSTAGSGVTLTVTDASGNSSSCIGNVNVTDTIPPAAICKNASVSLTGSTASITAADVDNNSTDNCAIVSRSVTPSTFDCTNLGANTVTFTAADAANNTSSCAATVTVSDNTPPVAVTRNITVTLIGNSVSITEADVENGSTDNCTIVSRAVAPNTFTCSELGPNTVTLTVTDQSGNIGTAPAIVTVIDNTPPTAICKDFSVTLVNGTISITPADADNNSTDNCSIVTRTIVPNTFTCAELGVNSAVLTVTDQSSNSSSCNSQVTVLGSAPFTCSIESRLAPSNQNTGGNSTTIYLGYGPQSTTLVSTVAGQGQFSYSWTPTTGLSCTACPSPVFTPTAGGNYTFTLTVTSANGCTTKCEITICVLDIRVIGGCGGGNGGHPDNSPGHIYICHVPPGNPGNEHTLCIGVAGVPAHVPFHGGDRLGKCEQTCGSNKIGEEDLPELITDQNSGFNMLIYPNPFSSQFQLKVESEWSEPIDIKIFNVMGQLITSERGIEPNHDVYLGTNVANGFYFLEVTQAGFKKTIRVTKAK